LALSVVEISRNDADVNFVKLTILIWGNFGKMGFKMSRAMHVTSFLSLFTDLVDGRSRLTHVVNVRGVIYQKLNIERQIANRWIH